MASSFPNRRTPFYNPKAQTTWAFPAVCLAAFLLRLVNLGRQGLWFDEAYTAFVVRRPPAEMVQFLITDGVHPPLYYVLMAAWVRLFGDSEVSLRLPSAIGGGVAVWILYLLVRRMTGEREALVSAAFLGASPFLIWHSMDARMYSLECLAAVAAAFFFWEYLHRPAAGAFLGFIFSHALLYGTHYFGVFLLLAEAFFLILGWRDHLRVWIPFLAGQAAALAPLAVWGGILLQRENGSFGIGWISKPGWMDPVLTMVNFFAANGGQWNLAAVTVGLALLLLFTAAARSAAHTEAVRFGFFWLGIPVLMAWVLSQKIPIYIDRYLILSLPAAAFLASVGAGSLRGWKRWFFPTLLVGAMIPGVLGIHGPAEGYRKEGWREAAQSIRSQFQSGDVLLVRLFQVAVPLQYYQVLDRNWYVLETNSHVTLPEIEPGAGRFFLVYWFPAQSAHSFGTEIPAWAEDHDPRVAAWMEESFILLSKENDYRGVVVLVMKPAKG
ncbi:MAG: glycosyltransferase family 39 protein [Anaerolineales bacterium]|nr:glycosyltransferase family 39 protein [Anaerolineales bacterium]